MCPWWPARFFYSPDDSDGVRPGNASTPQVPPMLPPRPGSGVRPVQWRWRSGRSPPIEVRPRGRALRSKRRWSSRSCLARKQRSWSGAALCFVSHGDDVGGCGCGAVSLLSRCLEVRWFESLTFGVVLLGMSGNFRSWDEPPAFSWRHRLWIRDAICCCDSWLRGD